jgi:serine/alanine adding enzyme
MKHRIITDAESIDRDQWEHFVSDHPNGNVFQTPQMYEAYRATVNFKPIVVACYEEDAISGILLAVVQKEYKGIIGKLSTRSIIWGGPLITDNDIQVLEAIMNEYNKTIKKQSIYTQIRNIYSMEWAKNHFNKMGYIYEDHLNILIDLKKSKEQLWEKIHPKRRNKIRRAEKEGTIFRLLKNNDTLEKCYPILIDVYKRARLPLPHISLFKEILNWKKASSPLKFFTAFNNGKVIGVMMPLCWRDRVFAWYGGGYQQYLNKYPNDILPWELMKWGAENGYTVFDFGGAGKPGVPYGVRDYKLEFGGDLVNYGRFQKVHHSFTIQIAKLGLCGWRFLKH